MNHITDELINSLIDDDLDAGTRSEIYSHFRTCPDCAMKFDEYNKVNSLLNRLPVTAAPDNTADKVISAILILKNQPEKLPLLLKATLFLLSGMLMFLTFYIFYGLNGGSPAESQSIKPVILDYSVQLKNAVWNLINPKYYTTLSFSFIAVFSMSLFFLFERIRTLKYIK